MKKLLALFMSICILTSATSLNLVFADGDITEKKEIDVIQEKYGLQDVEEIPAGIVPIEVSSGELENFLNEIQEENNMEVVSYNNLNIKNNIESYVRSSDSYTKRISKDVLIGIGLWQCLYATIKVENGEITNVFNGGMSYVGFSPGVELDSASVLFSHDISSDRKTVTLYGEADVNYYLLIDGFVKLFSAHKTMNYKYTLD